MIRGRIYTRPVWLLFHQWFAHLIWPWEGPNYPSRSCNGPNGPKRPKFKQNKQRPGPVLEAYCTLHPRSGADQFYPDHSLTQTDLTQTCLTWTAISLVTDSKADQSEPV